MNKKVLLGVYKTNNFIGKSVKEQNPNVLLDLFKIKSNKWKTFGVKNTSQIDKSVIKTFTDNGYVWNTLDNSSDRGRAVDINLINPITGKPMVGSSSGTAINVLYGINTVGIGTDGGGSVLAPAISLNLYSVLLSGAGVKGIYERKSTDNIKFIPGIGLITQNFEDLYEASNLFLEKEEKSSKEKKLGKKIKIALDKELSNSNYIKKLCGLCDLEEIKTDKKLFYREDLISELSGILLKNDIFIYLEENVEVKGMGDSICGVLGYETLNIQKKSNKRYLKIANMINCSALSIPTSSLGTSIVILANGGKENLRRILEIAKIINREYRPKLFIDYFLNYASSDIDNRTFKI